MGNSICRACFGGKRHSNRADAPIAEQGAPPNAARGPATGDVAQNAHSGDRFVRESAHDVQARSSMTGGKAGRPCGEKEMPASSSSSTAGAHGKRPAQTLSMINGPAFDPDRVIPDDLRLQLAKIEKYSPGFRSLLGRLVVKLGRISVSERQDVEHLGAWCDSSAGKIFLNSEKLDPLNPVDAVGLSHLVFELVNIDRGDELRRVLEKAEEGGFRIDAKRSLAGSGVGAPSEEELRNEEARLFTFEVEAEELGSMEVHHEIFQEMKSNYLKQHPEVKSCWDSFRYLLSADEKALRKYHRFHRLANEDRFQNLLDDISDGAATKESIIKKYADSAHGLGYFNMYLEHYYRPAG